MPKLVCHLQKNSRSKLKTIEKHNNNAFYDSIGNFIVNNNTNNYYLISSAEDNLTKNIFSRVATRENPHINIRKDAVLLCDIIISASSDFFVSLSDQQIKTFFIKSCEFLKEKYTAENCVYAVVHMQETVPHMHFGIVPMTSDNFLCAKKLFDRNELRQLQTELPQLLLNSGFVFEKANINSNKEQNSTNVCDDTTKEYITQIKNLEKAVNSLKLENIYLKRKLLSILNSVEDSSFTGESLLNIK